MTIDINYKGIDLTIEGEYEPSEEEVTYESDLSGYPGSNSSFIIYEVFVEEVDIFDIISDFDLEALEELILNEILR